MWCDNVSITALFANPVFHSTTKHLEVDYHYVREKVLHRDLKIRFVSGTDNMVDIFTKPLPAPPFLSFHSKLLVDSSPYRLWGDVEDEAQAQRNGGSGSTQVQQRMHHLRLYQLLKRTISLKLMRTVSLKA